MPEIFSPPLIQAQSWEEAQRKFNEIIRQMARMLNNIYSGANIPTDRIKDEAITAVKLAVGSITADRYYELRNTYVFSDQDSLDASYPFEMDFEIVSEMTAINSVKLSFRIREFRAYATTVPSGGGHTTPSGGGHTTPSGGGATSGATGSASGGGSTSGSQTHDHAGSTAGGSGSHTHNVRIHNGTPDYFIGVNVGNNRFEWTEANIDLATLTGAASHTHPLNITSDGSHSHSTPDHTHPNHTHTTPDHTHTVSAHTHTVSNHTHSLTFGIYEDTQSPTLHYHIDNGAGYAAASGDYTTDQLDLDITSSVSGTGFKRIKFDSDLRTRISAWVLCKVDLTA